MPEPAEFSVFVREPEPLTLEQQRADARISERQRCIEVILRHRTEIDVGTSWYRLASWLDEDTADAGVADRDPGESEDWGEAEPADPDRAAALQLCNDLVDRLVEFIANMRRLSEENERLRGQMATDREHAALKVIRVGDFLRMALSIIQSGEEQYRSPEAPIAQSLGLVVEDPGAAAAAGEVPDASSD